MHVHICCTLNAISCRLQRKDDHDCFERLKMKKKKEYRIEDIRTALHGMLQGKSARQMSELTRVPRSNLMRWFEKVTGARANVRAKLSDVERNKFNEVVANFRPARSGKHARYFFDDEEELFVCTVEEAHDAAFPYDRHALLHIVNETGVKVYGSNFEVGKNWVYKFEKRWEKRIDKVKCGNISGARGKKATAEVRDTMFGKFQKFLDKLKAQGVFTDEQVQNLGDHMCKQL